MEPPPEPDFQLACPVCSAFNSADFRFCPHCGHRLGAPDMVDKPPPQGFSPRRLAGLLGCVLLLALALDIAFEGFYWQSIQGWLRYYGVWRPSADSARQATLIPDSSPPATAPRLLDDPAVTAEINRLEQASPETSPRSEPSSGLAVELTLFDRDGDHLRQARAILSHNERRVVSTFESIYGAYRGVVHLPDQSTPLVQTVERADPAANIAILSLAPPPVASTPPRLTLEGLARATYEETPAEQRYLAEKRARAKRWDEAIGHWKKLIEMDRALRREIEAPFGEAFLQSSAAALEEGRRADALARLLDAVEWLPEHGEIRRRLAEHLIAIGEYREAIDQYWQALELLPTQAPDLVRAIVGVYREWSEELVRQGDPTAAAVLLREVLQFDATNGELYFALGRAEFRRQALEAAIEAFETALAYDPGLRGEVEPYLTRTRALLGGPQTIVINFAPGSTRIEVPVILNGRLEVPFIIDTGASVTLIPAWAAEMLGYRPPATSEWVRVQTAGGPRRLPYAAVNRIEVQGLGLSNLPVLFGDLPGYDARRGLLGMDFLRHFALAVDHDIGRMTLRLK
jgi:tetratricopeptide (TPR) repeat protein